MSTAAIAQPSPTRRMPVALYDLTVAMAVAAGIFLWHLASGMPQLADAGGDNDSLMRLVQVRDLLAGQGWFDLHQYRMGPEGGFLMHWSRLVDAPIAAIMLAVTALGGSAALAEAVAQTVWPMLLMGLALFIIVRLARMLGGDWAVLPAAALGAAALYFVNVFRPGGLDHHNLQIVSMLAMIALLFGPGRSTAALAGLCAALTLAIGMETVPYVAVAGACAALLFLAGGRDQAASAAAFGLALAGGTLAAFLLTVDPALWWTPYCDALSGVQLSLAALGGAGLAAVAAIPAANATFGRRLASLALLGAVFLATARLGFPQCLGDPFAGLDPRLRENWLDKVSEAQSALSLAGRDWASLLPYYVTPALGMIVLLAAAAKGAWTRQRLIYGAFLAAAILVSLWQVRGAMFSVTLAPVALAAWVGSLRQRQAERGGTGATAAVLAAWLVSFNTIWAFAGNTLSSDTPGAPSANDAGKGEKIGTGCSANALFAELAALPAGTVLAVSDLGSPILANTPHRALAGPYHRNVAGNLLMMDMMTGAAADNERRARENDVTYVVLCRRNPETSVYSASAPHGLLADIVAGRLPQWLQADPASAGKAIEIFRVVAQ